MQRLSAPPNQDGSVLGMRPGGVAASILDYLAFA